MRSSSGAKRPRSLLATPSVGRAPGFSAACNRGVANDMAAISGRVSCGWSGRELRSNIAVEDGGTDMVEAAVEIGPDLAAKIGPALAECKILAEIGAGHGIDHALEQREAVLTAGQ